MNITKNLITQLKAHGTYPKLVYRAFEQKSYSDDFVLRGKFRMGNLKIYINHEDEKRCDSLEGQGHIQTFGIENTIHFAKSSDEAFVTNKPGYVHKHIELQNPMFLFCCSKPDVDLEHMKRQFGPFLIRIDQPRRLAQEISNYLETLPYKFAGGIEGCSIKYNKGNKVKNNPAGIDLAKLAYSQKPIEFCQDKEFRFVAIVTGRHTTRFNEDYLHIDLGHILDYVTIIKVNR